ncbi:Ion transport protein [[Leptolyngbya] sp. PCC 7376]|uniref:ion transporter n=1 Tax=[Leptolyngbya] sp. PCC 7376 TaxID=111781 RepID=UPI00029ED870|nr:ion transporter [[Leptolyngbya] sp. PCC 7376]AFY38461.1 Ion transport protein [[Leptolyngbya] sp. PCC 7376]
MTSQTSWRLTIGQYLDDFESVIGRSINIVLCFFIFLSSGIFVAQTYTLPPNISDILSYVDYAILGLFTIEYCLRLICAEAPLKFLFSIAAIIDLLAIAPLFFGFFDARFLRLFRWFRLLRLIRFFRLEISILNVKAEDTIILSRIVLTLFTIIFIYSGLIYQVEHNVNPYIFKNFLDALYFAIVTMTTVGFGDQIPISYAGKFVTLMMILTGIAVIPWQLGDLVRQFIKSTSQREIDCGKCGLAFHDQDAQFCKRCGTILEQDS